MTFPIPYQSIKSRKDSIAILDIGSSKIACFIAEPDDQGELHITGIGHHHAQGLRSGTITDSASAEASIAAAVNLAEQMAGATVDNVMVSLNLPDMRSHLMNVELNISGGAVSEQDISDILLEANRSVESDDRQIIHSFITQYQLDGAKGIRDPRNMYGMLLKADIHIITIDKRKLINLANMISRCHLDIAEFVASPYTSGLGCLETDEQELGVTLIDMGAYETSMAIFSGGANIYNCIIPIGGQHVTKDLAQGIPTSLTTAERIKTLHGSVLATANDDQSMITIPAMGEDYGDGESSISRTQVVSIIRPRIEEVFELLYDHIEESRMAALMGRHIVLTGGACQLMGVRELATSVFAKQVRIGKPRLFPGLAESVSSPCFSCAVGMLNYAVYRPMEDALQTSSYRKPQSFSLPRLVGWLKERF